MTTVEFRKMQQDADDRDIRSEDLFVAAGCIVITLLWARFLFEVLV